MRVNKQKRNKLLGQPETVVLSPTSCLYNGKKYTYVKQTAEDIADILRPLLEYIEWWDKGWWYRITHRKEEPKL